MADPRIQSRFRQSAPLIGFSPRVPGNRGGAQLKDTVIEPVDSGDAMDVDGEVSRDFIG